MLTEHPLLTLIAGALAFFQQTGLQNVGYRQPPSSLNLSPIDGAVGIGLSPTLKWNPSAKAVSYDVYFGTSSPPPLVKTTTQTSYGPGLLKPSATYYWKVVAKNSDGSTSSDGGEFRTIAQRGPSCDLNSDGVVNLIDVQLAVKQALGTASCDSPDLNKDGVCDKADVRRVVDAALGKGCRIGP